MTNLLSQLKRLLLILFLCPFVVSAQLSAEDKLHIDSLKQVINRAEHDSVKVKAWKAWDNIIYVSNPDLDFELNKKIEALCAKNLEKELPKNEEDFYLKAQGSALNVIGIIYKNQGHYAKAIEFYSRGLQIQEKIGDKKGISSTLGNIGNIYYNLNEFDMAIAYHTRSLKIKEEMDDKKGIANSLNNLGGIYVERKEFPKALEYFKRSLKLREELGDQSGIAQCLANAGKMYEEQGNENKAIDHYTRSLMIREDIGDKAGIANSLNYIGDINLSQGNYERCIEYNERALHLAEEIESAKEIMAASHSLFKSYEKLGKHKKALEMHKLFIKTSGILDSEANQKEVIRQEYKYEYEKKTAIQEAENEKDKLKVKQQEQLAYFLYIGLALALLFAIFILNRFRVTIKQKGVIEEKNTEILDSIKYAKRIQSAILPPNKIVQQYLPNSFVLYKPKDIVAGDFYWLEYKENKVLFAAADCTGHGVPGAMVSVVCNNGLNRSVREYGLTDPGEILDKTREIVVQEFEKSEDDVKDGMDIALCSLDGLQLKYAGANNPIWIIRDNNILETKADKQPISKSENPTSYTTHTINLQKGDSIYIFSDGYVDQFGGAKGKKLKANAFRELLLNIQKKSMKEQGDILNQYFENWRGKLEQVDDVCVIGIRVD